jgi:glycosyltransferase involved in cell wall biosynthesis
VRPAIKVAVNGTSLLIPQTGVASYTRNLADAVLMTGAVNMLLFYGWGWSEEVLRPANGRRRSLRSILAKIPRPYWFGDFGVKQHRFTRGVRRSAFDLYHEPNYLPYRFSGPTVITVHDMSPLRYPETHPAQRVSVIQRCLPRAVERAAHIIVVSDFTKQEVLTLLNVDPARVHRIYNGVTSDYRPRTPTETAACLTKHGLTHGGYVLAVGSLEPRKNLLEAIDAHASMSAVDRLTLVIAGPKGWLSDEVERRIGSAQRSGQIRWLGYVPHEDLLQIYSGARLLVYPSLYEGFGLPVLEAMASGVPVVCSNMASLPEVAGTAALMVEPGDPARLGDAMLRLLHDRDEANRRVQLGLAHARRFTWRRCANETLEVYRQAVAA